MFLDPFCCSGFFGIFGLEIQLHGVISFKDLLKFHPNFLSDVCNKQIPLGYIRIDFFQILIKFEVLITLIPLAIKVKDDDLFNLSEDSEKWIKMKKNYERKVRVYNNL